MNVEDLIRAGESYGYQKPKTYNTPATNTTSAQPDSYLGNSLQALARIPRELGANVKDLVSRYGETAATIGAGMLPGAGTVEAPQNYRAGNEAFAQGDWLRGAGQYAMGAYNQATDLIPGTPTLAHGIVPAAGAKALQDLKGLYEPTTEMLPKKTITWEDLEGKAIIATQGDRTMAGHRILGTEQDGAFQSPVHIQGGRDFARAEAAQGPDASGWASTRSGAVPLNNKVNRLMAEDIEPVLAYMPLGMKSSDFTTQSYNVFEQLLRQRGGEEAMKAISKDMPFDASIDSMRNWFLNASGTARSDAFKKMGTKGRLAASGVDPDEVRHLLRDPGLANANTGDIGYGFIRPTGKITAEGAIPHADYSHQLGGEYLGEFAPGMITPRSVAFMDTYARNPALAQMPDLKVDHTFKTQLPYQIVNSEMVDRLMGLQRMYGQ